MAHYLLRIVGREQVGGNIEWYKGTIVLVVVHLSAEHHVVSRPIGGLLSGDYR